MHNLPEPYKTLFEVVSLDCRPEAVPELIRKGAKLDYTDPNNGRTFLYAAVRANRIRAVQSLLQNGADPSQRFTYRSPVDGGIEADRVALHYASSPEMVAVLLAAGTDVNAIDAIGTTPLMCAAFHGYLPVVEALLAAGANALARQDRQRVRRAPSARDLAEVKIKFFEKFVAGRNPDLTADRLRCYGRIREVLLAAENGADSSS
jgi:ankyrin repeat protein